MDEERWKIIWFTTVKEIYKRSTLLCVKIKSGSRSAVMILSPGVGLKETHFFTLTNIQMHGGEIS